MVKKSHDVVDNFNPLKYLWELTLFDHFMAVQPATLLDPGVLAKIRGAVSKWSYCARVWAFYGLIAPHELSAGTVYRAALPARKKA